MRRVVRERVEAGLEAERVEKMADSGGGEFLLMNGMW